MIRRYFRNHEKQRMLVIFNALLCIALTATMLIEVCLSFQVQISDVQTQIQIDNETYYPPPMVFNTNGPTYFNSYARLKLMVTSNHGEIFKTTNFSASLDNATWIDLPIAHNQSDLDSKEYADLGLVELDSPQITIYFKTYIPPQTITVDVPPNVPNPYQQILDSNFGLVLEATPVPSSLDTGKSLFTFFTAFSATFLIYNFFKPKQSLKKSKMKKKPKLPLNV